MAELGLLPPYTENDVKQAYYGKARRAHPDAGGSSERFKRLQSAYEKATDYVLAHQPQWLFIAGSVDTYEKQQRLIEKLKRYGAVIAFEKAVGVSRNWGDELGQVFERIVSIQLTGPAVDDGVIDLLVRYKAILGKLRRLSLAGSNVSDSGIERLKALPSIQSLDVRNTPISGKGLKVVDWLPELHTLDIRGASIGCMAYARLAWFCAGLKLIAS